MGESAPPLLWRAGGAGASFGHVSGGWLGALVGVVAAGYGRGIYNGSTVGNMTLSQRLERARQQREAEQPARPMRPYAPMCPCGCGLTITRRTVQP